MSSKIWSLKSPDSQPANVDWVFVAGRTLKRQGKLVGDVGSVIERAKRDVAVIKGMVEKAQSNN